jgi:hypothetical protein
MQYHATVKLDQGRLVSSPRPCYSICRTAPTPLICNVGDADLAEIDTDVNYHLVPGFISTTRRNHHLVFCLFTSLRHDSCLQYYVTSQLKPSKSTLNLLPVSVTKTQRLEKVSSSTLKVFSSVVEILMIAMAGGKRQKARINSQPRTPSKPKVPERPVIGSSSTWRTEQLDRFLVWQGVSDVKTMIPEKWFEFGQLDNYQSCLNTFYQEANGSTQSSHLSGAR